MQTHHTEDQVQIKIKIDKIHVSQFSQRDTPNDISEDEDINFNHNINFRASDLTQSIDTQLNVTVVRAKSNQELASISVNSSFKLFEGFEKMKELGGIPSGLILLTINLTYSTTRGILLERFAGTKLQSFYLPIINPTEILQQIEKSIKDSSNK